MDIGRGGRWKGMDGVVTDGVGRQWTCPEV